MGKEMDEYNRSKIDRRNEGKDEQTFEEWKKEKEDIKKAEEEERKRRKKKKRKDREERERKEREERKKVRAAAVDDDLYKPNRSRKETKEKVEIDEEDEGNLKDLRGYKKTSDGRTTSYFNNELDEKTKSLIGDITPKAISAADANNSSVMQNGGSAWNTAGTFESRNVTPWAKERMKELLSNAEFEGGACIVSVVNVKDINGDAEIT